MWNYERRLEYPVNITRPNAKIAQIIISQYGGPDGEAAASFRYLSQRYSMPYRKVAGLLTDIGTEELAIWPRAAGGIPFNACEFQSKGDAITDLFEDMAADGTIV